jgi:hypothetical protein
MDEQFLSEKIDLKCDLNHGSEATADGVVRSLPAGALHECQGFH